jgi:hypothetical protein
MNDRVSLYPGRVTLTPVAGQTNTYDMTRADQPTQEGTPLNKASLLTDATAAMLDLGADAVPDNALKILSRLHTHLGDDYLWRKQSISGEIKEATEDVSLGRMADDATYYYYDSVQLDLANKKIVGVGEHIIKNQSNGSSEWNKIIGKYILYPYTKGSWPPDTFYRVTARTYSHDAIFTAYAEYAEFTSGPAQYLNSPNADAYPSGVVGSVQYDALGKIGDKLQIQTGTYVGSGVYGEGDQNSLTFNFVPKIVIVIYKTNTDLGGNSGFIYIGQPGTAGGERFTVQDRTLFWYNSNSAREQCNDLNSVYYYVAIG